MLKPLLFLAALITLTPSAFALSPKNAQQTCGRLSYQFQAECYQSALRPGTSELALGACDRYQSNVGTLACVNIVGGRRMQHDAVIACDRIQNENYTTNCLAAIADRVYGVNEVGVCDRMPDAISTIDCFNRLGQSYRPEPIRQDSPYSFQWSNNNNCKLMLNGQFSGRLVNDVYCQGASGKDIVSYEWSRAGNCKLMINGQYSNRNVANEFCNARF